MEGGQLWSMMYDSLLEGFAHSLYGFPEFQALIISMIRKSVQNFTDCL